jgi:hypothetical protein
MRVACALVALLLAAGRADADEPWKQGVTPEQMATAQKLLEEGNALFLERDHAGARAKYQQALAAWDHPAIRFNLVRTLIPLDRIVEAYDNLELALKYGAAPLEENVYAEALAYQKLLANQIASVIVACKQSGVTVTLDGQPLLTCPGSQRHRVLPGQHQIVAKKPGFLTHTVEVVALGGRRETVELRVEPLGEVGRIEHRWRTWVPFDVMGTGLGVAGIGALVQYMASSDHDRYYSLVGRECAPLGCAPGYEQDLKDRAILENRIAIATIGVGAATLVTGGVMLYLNRARTVYTQDAQPPVVVAPQRGGGTVNVRVRF